MPSFAYPTEPAERDRWILSRRGVRNPIQIDQPAGFFTERERVESGEIVSALTILLTNRECPWRCLMCDLWRNTLEETVPIGAIPAQIDWALKELGGTRSTASHSSQNESEPGLRPGSAGTLRPTFPGKQSNRFHQLKLYNSGSFFDVRAIPPEDYPAIAEPAAQFDNVIVECHPALVNERVLRFRDLLPRNTRLEVAMGLETAHPEVLEKLNKRMTLDQYALAARWLRQRDIAVRAFVLVKPPFLNEAEALEWAKRSIDFAFDCGAGVVSLIPTRGGNGAMEMLAKRGLFTPPKLFTLERALHYGVALARGRVFADLWDLEKLSDCAACFPKRRARIESINLQQRLFASIPCDRCAYDGAR